MSSVKRGVSGFSEEDHISKSDNRKLIQRWIELKKHLNYLESIEFVSKQKYIRLNKVLDNRNICKFAFYTDHILITIVRGHVNPDGSKSRNYFTLHDPQKLATEITWNSGTRIGNGYQINFDGNSDLDYIKCHQSEVCKPQLVSFFALITVFVEQSTTLLISLIVNPFFKFLMIL